MFLCPKHHFRPYNHFLQSPQKLLLSQPVQPPPSKLRWSRSVSLPNMSQNNSSNSGAHFNSPKTKKSAAPTLQHPNIARAGSPHQRSHSPSSPDTHGASRNGTPRKISGTLRDKGRDLARRLFSPLSSQQGSPTSPPDSPSSVPTHPSAPLSMLIYNPVRPVLVEYLPCHPRFPRQGGVVYLSLSPPDTLASFMERAKNMARRNNQSDLFGMWLRRDDVLSLHACWNQGDRDERIDSMIAGEEEWERVVALMSTRGWMDRL